MNTNELETYLSNIVDELGGALVEKPGDEYYYKVKVTRMREGDDGVLYRVGENDE